MLLGAVPLAAASETISGGGPPWTANEAASPPPVDLAHRYDYFTPAEAAFVEAASARMIPSDALGPGALEAGVPVFIDRQLAGDFGNATRMYMQGPWAKGEKTQGYQSRFTAGADVPRRHPGHRRRCGQGEQRRPSLG